MSTPTPTSQESNPSQMQPADFAALAIERIAALRMQHQLILLGMMELVRQSRVQGELFNSLAAVANGMAQLEQDFDRVERELVARLPTGARRDLH